MILRPYQVEGARWLAQQRHALLADEMRLGKTPQAIMAAAHLHADKILVVCPAIAVPHWQQEIKRWWPHSIAPYSVVRSYDRAKLERSSLLSKRWDVAIVDEAHFAKNPEAERTKLVYGKGGLGWASKRLWALSGTPAPKHAAELWPMLRAFGVVGMSYTDFIRRYCYCAPMSDVPLGTKTSMIPELKALLARCMLRRTRAQVAPDMPAIGYSFLEIDPVSRADLHLPSMSDAALAQLVESNPHADRESRIEVAKAKVLPLVEEIEFALDNGLLEQTVVFGWHVEPLQMLTQALSVRGVRVGLITGQTSGVLRQVIQDDFRAGKLDVVVANILAAGTAIDLSAASHAYMIELDWVPGNNVQAANRLISMQKDQPVTMDVVTWPGSTDDRVQKSLLRRVRELSKLY